MRYFSFLQSSLIVLFSIWGGCFSMSAQSSSEAVFKLISSKEEFTPGEYLIVSASDDGVTIASNGDWTGGVCRGTSLRMTDRQVHRPPMETVWQISKHSNGWSFKHVTTGKFLTQRQRLSSKSMGLASVPSMFHCTEIGSDGVALFTQHATCNSFCWNSETGVFSNYDSFGAHFQKVYFLKRTEKEDLQEKKTVKIGEALYATFYDKDISYELPTALTAYLGKITTHGTVALLPVERTIPKNTAVILHAEQAGNYALLPATTAVAPIDEKLNDLKGTNELLTLSPTTDNGIYMVLARQNGIIGFYRTETSIPAGKAFLYFSEQSVQAFSLEFKETITELPVAERDAHTVSGFYDLRGRRVKAAQKGEIYLKNGKCVILP